jgi:hypothetical protein
VSPAGGRTPLVWVVWPEVAHSDLARHPCQVGPTAPAPPRIGVALAIYGIKTWHGLRQEEMSGRLRYLSLLKQQGATLLVAMPPQREDVSAKSLKADTWHLVR